MYFMINSLQYSFNNSNVTNFQIKSERSFLGGKLHRTWTGFVQDWLATLGLVSRNNLPKENFSRRWTILRDAPINVKSVKSGFFNVHSFIDKYIEVRRLEANKNGLFDQVKALRTFGKQQQKTSSLELREDLESTLAKIDMLASPENEDEKFDQLQFMNQQISDLTNQIYSMNHQISLLGHQSDSLRPGWNHRSSTPTDYDLNETATPITPIPEQVTAQPRKRNLAKIVLSLGMLTLAVKAFKETPPEVRAAVRAGRIERALVQSLENHNRINETNISLDDWRARKNAANPGATLSALNLKKSGEGAKKPAKTAEPTPLDQILGRRKAITGGGEGKDDDQDSNQGVWN